MLSYPVYPEYGWRKNTPLDNLFFIWYNKQVSFTTYRTEELLNMKKKKLNVDLIISLLYAIVAITFGISQIKAHDLYIFSGSLFCLSGIFAIKASLKRVKIIRKQASIKYQNKQKLKRGVS
jgi:hypothetical protein